MEIKEYKMKGIKVRLLAGALAVCMAVPQTAWGADASMSGADLSVLENSAEGEYPEEKYPEEEYPENEYPESTFQEEELEQEPSEGQDKEPAADGETGEIIPGNNLMPEESDELSENEIISAGPEKEQEINAQAGEQQEGWVEEDGQIRYYQEDGTYVQNDFLKVDGKSFYFNEDGFLQTGWVTVEDKVYYLKKTGEPGKIGQMFTGQQNIGGKTYYFSPEGALQTGWQKIGGYHYYFQKSGTEGTLGRMVTGWLLNGGKIYYLKKTGDKGVKGRRFTGWVNIEGKTYHFDSSGVMQTGWQKIGKYYFYFKATGDYGTKGQMFTGLQKIGGKTYYFKKTGAFGVKGSRFTNYTYKVNGVAYHFGSDGVGEKVKMYTIHFYSEDGKTEYEDLQMKGYKGEKIQLPDVPQKLNYSGTGWSTKKNAAASSAKASGTTITVTGEMNFYGCWEKAKTVQFFYNSGTGEYLSLRENVTGSSLVLPSIKSASGYTFLGWSDKPKQNSYPKYRAGERIDVAKGMKLYSVVIQNPVAGPDSIQTSQAYDKVFFIGDSRTVGIKNQVVRLNGSVPENVEFFCQGRIGLKWFQENKDSIIERIKSKEGRVAVIWNLGVNNLYYNSSSGYRQTIANAYIEEMEQLAEALSSGSCDMYFMSVNPLNDNECHANGWGERYSKWVLDFNYLVRTGLKNYQYIDTYNYLINTGFQLADGLHYTPAVNGKIYNKAIEAIDTYAGETGEQE
jgi:glucan-binding YG repeat protein